MQIFRKSSFLFIVCWILSSILSPTPNVSASPPIQTDPPSSDPFINVSAEAGITATHQGSWNEYSKFRPFTDGYLASGQAWGDYDNDGWLDLYVTGNLDPNVLYQNNGDGTFSVSELSESVSLPDVMSGGAVWIDYDNDGWKDLYVLSHGANVLFHNEDGQGFLDVTDVAGVGDTGKGTTSTWGDYDGDGYLDLYVANWSCYPKCEPLDNTLAQDRLYHNNGDGTFSDVTDLLVYEQTLGAAFTASFVDYDNDGDPDIYVINDKLKNPIGNVLWRNDGPGCGGWCWSDVSAQTGADIVVHGMGLAIGDYDNDLDLDFYFSNMVEPSALLQNQGDGTFVETAEDAALPVQLSDLVGWGTSFLDYDNDGWLDLYLASTAFIVMSAMDGPLGMMFEFPNFLYHNNGDGTFSDTSPASWSEIPQPSMGFAYADYDQDGWVDFVISDWNDGYKLYRNQGLVGQGNRWLTVRLTGGGSVNRDAIGARVYLYLNGNRTLMQEVTSGSSLGGGNDKALHFGLGERKVQKLAVVWPDGLRQEFVAPPMNQLLELTYPEGELYADVSEEVGITALHKGSWRMFKADFETGYLGIGQAWGDYDNDGWLDLYVSGNQEPSVLYHNKQGGTFGISELSDSVALPDVWTGGAVWADYDNDGWKDLYVLAHGANVLYHNDNGTGFTDVTAEAGVGDTGKGSTATWGDYDNDGYLDLYVSNWACHPECDPLDNNLAQDRLYHNNGDGTFSDVSDLLVYEKLLGAGFTASFVDYDDDRDMDLYVVNDALMNPIGNVLWRNDGPGCGGWCWTDGSESTGAGIVIEGMGLAVGDYDNDLDLDFYFTNMVNPSALMQNQEGTFLEQAEEAGVEIGPSAGVGWGTTFFDYDNDGWLDLYVATTEFRNFDRETPPDGMHFDHPNQLYRNNGDGTFSEVSPASWRLNPQRSMGIAYADYDQDGWMDFVSGDWNRGYKLYRNQGNSGLGNHWLSVRLIGDGPVNRDAIGARVYLRTSDGRTLMQEVKNGSSLGAGNDTALHFGLGSTGVTWMTVLWPDGSVRLYKNVTTDQILHVSYRRGSSDQLMSSDAD